MTTRRLLAFVVEDDPLDPGEGLSNALREVQAERGQRAQRTAEQEAEAEQRTLTIARWLDLVPETHGPIDLVNFAFQREPFYTRAAVDDREQVLEKATQAGASAGMIRVALFSADVRQRNVLYTFPTDKELGPFSQSRFGPIIRASERLAARIRQDDGAKVDNVFAKRFGSDGWLFMRGTEKPIESLPIDMLIADEFNYSNLEHLADSEYRVTGPKSLGLIRRLGVPTIPGFGVSRYYLDSDQRGWTVKCEGCGEQNRLQGFEAFRDNVDIEGVRLVCRKPDCRRELDVRKGEWVAKHPERDVKGYNVPKLLMPSKRVLAGVIARSKRTRPKDKERFLNRDLGVAWAPEEGRLSLEQVQACQRPELRPVDPWAVVPPSSYLRVMGVDMASMRALNVTIEEKVGTDPDDLRAFKLWTGEVQDDPARGSAFQQVCRLIDIFGIYMVGIDNNPDGRFGIALAARYPGRVYRIQFFEPGAGGRSAPKEWTVNDAESFVSLHRTIAYDSTFSRFRTQQVLLPPLETLPEDYAEHLGNLYRQKTEDGAKVSVSYVVTGDHDYAQAEAYCLAALELYWRRVGLGIALDPTPTPLRDLDPYQPPEDDEEQGVLAGLPRYRSGFN